VAVPQLEADVAVTDKLKKILFSLVILFANLGQAFAEMMEKGKTKVKTVFNFFHQNSNDGKQVFDGSGREEANVIEPMIFIEHQINEDTAITGHFVFDFWTAASDTKLDGNTGASGGEPIKTQSRTSANVGAKREVKKWTYGANLGFSSEYDYSSLNGSLNASRSFAKDNFTLGAGIQYYKDSVSLFPDLTPPGAAKIVNDKDRTIVATALTASQILTRKDIIHFGINYIKAKGFLESTASSVSVAGVREVENLPENRERYAASTRWVHGLSETSALNLSYRYYWDQWQANAHTARLAYLVEINENEDFLEFFTRFHNQSAVEHYGESFDNAKAFMTSDSDVAKFNSYEAGVYHTKTLGEMGDFKLLGFDFENVSWSNSLVYGIRSNGLRMGYLQTALTVEF
jgi:hypothetical protein